jgi:hypothetical protein
VAGYPFLIRGSDADGEGHIWAIDGVEELGGQPAGCKFASAQPHVYFHHDFGWDGSSNRWYKDYFFGEFTQKRRMITARPR